MEGKILKLFIIEDDFIIQFYIERIAQKIGYEITGKARSFAETLELLKNDKPDLILLDIGLQGEKDGVDTAEIINRDYQIPFVFMTGNSDQFTIDRAEKTKPLGFIYKPIDEYGLIEKLVEFKNRI
jgi:response regulator of citrate/malate metabolism